MEKIGELELYVGTKEEYNIAKRKGMKIVCALNRAKGYVTHQSIVGWQGRGCDKSSPYYLFKETKDAIYLNMIDGDNPKYVNDEMIDPALTFIHTNLKAKEKVFVYCSLGESRSPSIALMYMLQYGLIEKHPDVLMNFRKNYYPKYQPKNGNALYIKRRWV